MISENMNAAPPSPALLFETINGYQRTAAIKTAIQLDVFSPLVEKPATADAIAAHAKASPRGMRILCDYLTFLGFLNRTDKGYTLTKDSAVFLNPKSPAYAGGTLDFLLSPDISGGFDSLTEAVRKGGTASSKEGTMSHENPVWLSFARNMGPLMIPAANALAGLIPLDQSRPTKVLDISASHGAWGLAFARPNPKAQIVGLDWAPVLQIARENAKAGGAADRYSTIAGSAFDVDFGTDYDIVLLPNFLHHFNTADCIRLLKKTNAALRPGGTVAIVEFVPNSDRVTPPPAAGFSLVMLASTAEGDTYTLAEYAAMLAQAGFKPPVQHNLPASVNAAVIAKK
jgi:ubiquinone/menaquinone biosynthesis C-methylase UbiE